MNILSKIPYKQVPIYINRMDAGILPFPDYKGWNISSSIKLFEYLACGKTVIVTNIPAHKRVIKNENFAFWADDQNPYSISKAILEAYKNRKNFEKLGSGARKFVEKKL